jgi:hypothetical protein
VKKLGNRRVGDTIRPAQGVCKDFCKPFLLSVSCSHTIANRHKLKEMTNESFSPIMRDNFADFCAGSLSSVSRRYAMWSYFNTAFDRDLSHRRHAKWSYLIVRGFGDW